MKHPKEFQTVKSGLKFPKGKDTLTGIIKPDTHTAPEGEREGGKDEVAWKCFKQAIKLVKPDFFVDIGDAGEWTSVNPNLWKGKKKPELNHILPWLSKEAQVLNQDFDELDKLLPKGCQKYFIQGNHELWIDNLINETPQLGKIFALPELLHLKDRGYKYIEHGKWLQMGKLFLSHGTQASGVNHNRSMLIRFGQNLMYGHVHDLCCYSMPRLLGTQKAWSVGGLLKMDKPFLKGDVTNWEHGFCIVHVHKSGYFSVEQVSIVHGTCWINGKKVQADGER